MEWKRSKLLFYNAFIEKSFILLKSLLFQLPLFDELNIVKTSKTFRGYARTYSFEIIDSKHPLVQLTISKPSIKRFV